MVKDELESDIPSCEGHNERTLVFLAVRMGEAMLNGMGFVGDVLSEDELFDKFKVMCLFVSSSARWRRTTSLRKHGWAVILAFVLVRYACDSATAQMSQITYCERNRVSFW